MLIMVKHATPGLLTLGRDSNNGPIRMITTNTSDAEKRLVTCENKKRVKCIPQLSKRCRLFKDKLFFISIPASFPRQNLAQMT